jgi:hypothetical protein
MALRLQVRLFFMEQTEMGKADEYMERIGTMHMLAAQGEPTALRAATDVAMAGAYLHCATIVKNGLTPQQQLHLQDLSKVQLKPPQTLAMPFGVRLKLLVAIAFCLLLPLRSRGRLK